mmetsp:Transcript_10262/g.28797  ORF Transcript_10262/g.28797 Transcript_10262/m.28797 type:complete len:429 (-) Transcript_10262:16-1302(-)
MLNAAEDGLALVRIAMIKPQLIPRHAAVGLAIAFCFFVVVLVGAEEDLLLSPTGTDQQQPHKASAAASAASASFANTDDLLWFHTTTTRAVDILAKARRRDVIIASASAGASWAKTTPGSTTSAAEGGLRFLAESESSDSCDDKLKKCRGALDMCRDGEAANAGPSYLFVQMAQTCKLKEKTDSKGEAYYELSSKDMDDDTYIFIDRPYRTAGTVKTKQFFNDFDTTFSTETGGKPNGVITFRHRNTDNFEGPLMSVFVKAATAALQEIPAVNAYIDDEAKEVVYRDYCDISVAVASPNGLVVPVLRNTEAMSFADVERNIAMYGQKARDGTLALDDMAGGTFTISNGGVFGSLMGTPIINPPQSAILGMHATKMRAVVNEKGEVVARPMMYLALTYDHRLIDGREGVTFLKGIADRITDPSRLLLDL